MIDLFLPIGISFYTFQSISYAVDVYKNKVQATPSFLQYLFYLTFFPLLLAGPITRAPLFFPQIQNNKKVSEEMIYGGLFLIISGIIKKAVIADYISLYNNWIFDSPLSYSGFEGAMGVIGYTVQIYCDFSGYSDISIGIAAIMGFRLVQNFNFPYQAVNLSDFWRRWHISLSTWLKDYIYIPLGGNRQGKLHTYINNMVTMLVAGLWHGASWMFILWGGLHGTGLIIQKMNKGWLDKLPDRFFIRFLSWSITFLFIMFTWIFFRAKDWQTAISLLSRIRHDFDINYLLPFWHARTTWCVFIIIAFLFHGLRENQYNRIKYSFIKLPWLVKLLIFTVAVQLVIQFQSGNIQPFIYYQF